MITIRELSKDFGKLRALDAVSFDVAEGEVFALLGPNGAGKSTVLNVLCTLMVPTSGSVLVAGSDVARFPRVVRKSLGIMFQEHTIDLQLTAEENLRFHAVLYDVPAAAVEDRIDRVLELVHLTDRRKDAVSTFSRGMARRLEVARGMLHTPQVLILDEPTVGLDPQTRAVLWDDVLRLRETENVTVVFTTHYMEEAEHADRVAIIDHGRIVALDTPTGLKALLGDDVIELKTTNDPAAADALRSQGFDASLSAEGVRIAVANGDRMVARVLQCVDSEVLEVHVHRPNLEDVFLSFTGREIREEAADDLLQASVVSFSTRR